MVTVTQSARIGIPLRDPHGAWSVHKLTESAVIFGVLVLIDAVARARSDRWRIRAVVQRVRERWTRRRLGLAVAGLLAYHLVYLCYHNLKSWDVFEAPRDQMLLDLDRWLFWGRSPAVLLHDLLGQHVAAYVLTFVYESFSTIVSISFVAALVFTPRIKEGFVGLAAGMWIWILGTASYYAIPTLGPFHSAAQEFADLPHTAIQDSQARYMAQRAHLLADPQAHDAVAQVSAFASLHVGVLTVIVLMARYYGLRRLAQVLTVWLAGTVLATVYFGWHFFVDDVAGVVLAFLAVWLGRWTIRPPGRLGRSTRAPRPTSA